MFSQAHWRLASLISFMVVKELLTDKTLRPLSMRTLRTCPASIVLYSVTTLFPHISMTVPALRKAA